MVEEIKMDLVQDEAFAVNAPIISKVNCMMDLSTYAQRYDGPNRIERLIFIAYRSTSSFEALSLLITELLTGINTDMYKKVTSNAIALFPNEFVLDNNWVETTNSKCMIKLEKLESELTVAKNSMIKESIRTAYNQLAEFYTRRGNLQEALKGYIRTRDYCTTARHNIEMCMNVIAVSIQLGNFRHITSYINKAEGISDSSPLIKSKIKIASGLVALHDSQFKVAARKFLDIEIDAGGQFGDIISAEDIAVYGTILGLATLDRKELRTCLVENSNFKCFTELVPVMRQLIQDFFSGNYSSFFSRLSDFKSNLYLDIYLSAYTDELLIQISDRILIQYFSPYNTVDMTKMSIALGYDLPTLEKTLSKLISTNKISGRIDSQAHTLHRCTLNDRNLTVQKVLRVSRQHIADTRRNILRLSLLKNGLTISSTASSSSWTGVRHPGDMSNLLPSTLLSPPGTGRLPDSYYSTTSSSSCINPTLRLPSRNYDPDDPEDDTEMNIDDEDDIRELDNQQDDYGL